MPCCFNERVPCSRPGMARSTRRSKPDQRGAETLGGLPAQLHAIRKVGFDQLVRENACKDTRCGRPACSPWRDWKTLYLSLPPHVPREPSLKRQPRRRTQESLVKCGCASTVEGARAADLSAITACPRFSCSLDEADTANNIKRRRHRNYAVHGNMFTTNSTRC